MNEGAGNDNLAARRRRNKLILIGFGVVVALLLLIVTCGPDSGDGKSAPATSASAIPPPPTMAAPSGCRTADQALVDLINGGFLDPGQHLVDAQIVTGRNAQYIGGNIMGADGAKLSSQDTWAVVDGVGFSITSDARERTAFVDGRDMPALEDWADANDVVGKCVGAVERARNAQGG